MTEVPYLALKNPHLFNLSDEQIEQYDKKLAAIKNNSGYGKLEVKEIPQFSDASLIERAYVELQNRGINIDVIIVDLLDHMMPVVKAWGENDEQAKAAADLKGLAIICEVPVLAATQASTEAENKQDKGKKFGKMDVYGSKRKVHATNTLIYIVQAHQDESQLITSKGGTKNKIDECDWLWNIQIAKNRDGDLFSFEARHHVEIGKVTQVAQGLSNAGANSPIQKSIEELKEEEVLANEEAKKSGQAVTEAEVPAEVPKRAFHKKTKIS
jgi:replicative DNA helicase